MKFIIPILFSILCLSDLPAQSKEPDYTKGETLESGRNCWNLGSTGAIGNIWHEKGYYATSKTRQIQIRKEINTSN